MSLLLCHLLLLPSVLSFAEVWGCPSAPNLSLPGLPEPLFSSLALWKESQQVNKMAADVLKHVVILQRLLVCGGADWQGANGRCYSWAPRSDNYFVCLFLFKCSLVKSL